MCHFHVLVDAEEAVIGRVNLVDVTDGSAELGFCVARHVTGRGVATEAVRRISTTAASEYGLHVLFAATTVDHASSQAVLSRTGFRPVGGTELDGRPGLAFRRVLRGATG